MRWVSAFAPRHGPRSASTRPGQTLVEFAVGVTLFFLLVGGIVEGSRLIYCYVALGHAVHEGARLAVLTQSEVPVTEVDVRDRVVDAASPLTVDGGSVTISVDSGSFAGRDLGDRVTVGASYVYRPVFVIVFGAGPFTLTRSAEMMVE